MVNVKVTENNGIHEIEIKNQPVLGRINLSKVDIATGKVAQGEATLEKATYGLYARNPILDPADGTVIYESNQKVGELVTDENSNATFDMLYLRKILYKRIETKLWLYIR